MNKQAQAGMSWLVIGCSEGFQYLTAVYNIHIILMNTSYLT